MWILHLAERLHTPDIEGWKNRGLVYYPPGLGPMDLDILCGSWGGCLSLRAMHGELIPELRDS